MNRRNLIKAAVGGATVLVLGQHEAAAEHIEVERLATRTYENEVMGTTLIVGISRYEDESAAKNEMDWLKNDSMDEWVEKTNEDDVTTEYEELEAVEAGDDSLAYNVFIGMEGFEVEMYITYVRTGRSIYSWAAPQGDEDAKRVLHSIIEDVTERYDEDEVDTDDGLLDQLPSLGYMGPFGYRMIEESVGNA